MLLWYCVVVMMPWTCSVFHDLVLWTWPYGAAVTLRWDNMVVTLWFGHDTLVCNNKAMILCCVQVALNLCLWLWSLCDHITMTLNTGHVTVTLCVVVMWPWPCVLWSCDRDLVCCGHITMTLDTGHVTVTLCVVVMWPWPCVLWSCGGRQPTSGRAESLSTPDITRPQHWHYTQQCGLVVWHYHVVGEQTYKRQCFMACLWCGQCTRLVLWHSVMSLEWPIYMSCLFHDNIHDLMICSPTVVCWQMWTHVFKCCNILLLNVNSVFWVFLWIFFLSLDKWETGFSFCFVCFLLLFVCVCVSVCFWHYSGSEPFTLC